MIFKNQDEDNDNTQFEFWQSYSDLMSALLLIFALVMSATLLQSMDVYHQKIQQENAINADLEAQKKENQLLIDRNKEQSELLEEQQKQIEKLIGLKEEIIISLREEFDKTDLNVDVDPTGSIACDASIMFLKESSELSEEGKAYLNNFIPVYFNAIMNSQYKDYISEIIIQGHTDDDGSYMHNLGLSQDRALSVCKYFLLDNKEIIKDFDEVGLQKIITANGRSFSDMIYDSSGNPDKDASRRVEFKFSLKDDEMIETMKNIFEE